MRQPLLLTLSHYLRTTPPVPSNDDHGYSESDMIYPLASFLLLETTGKNCQWAPTREWSSSFSVDVMVHDRIDIRDRRWIGSWERWSFFIKTGCCFDILAEFNSLFPQCKPKIGNLLSFCTCPVVSAGWQRCIYWKTAWGIPPIEKAAVNNLFWLDYLELPLQVWHQ